ncbi:MAG: hypothetical protein BBJ57_05230 [Desulfobacterales bacterium PC51MH44]|nr:MAG: hypothetical protein BBJ57_05230 [Desulfobacterales bacterium PC51MH44]
MENEDIVVTAIDISDEALHVARVNAGRFEVEDEIRFIRSDLFEAVGKDERFDIISSNPPYISDSEYEGVEPEVKADPRLAMLAGPKGLDIINRLLAEAPDYLTRPGYLMFEIGFDQSQEIFKIVQSDGRYSDCSLLKDLSDIDRVVICKVS